MIATPTPQTHPYQIISRGPASGPYQAFPDACRLDNGDIVAVFYAGYHHVSFPTADCPKGGRLCIVRSSDEGRTWTEPVAFYDDGNDNRDPHIAQMSDGSLICSFFSLLPGPVDENGYPTGVVVSTGIQLTRSFDGGYTWEEDVLPIIPQCKAWFASAPVRELSDGTYILGVYHESEDGTYAGVIRSTDKGQTWSEPIPIGKGAGINLPAETDVIELKDGTLYAALRGDENFRTNMHSSVSGDKGLTWSPVKDLGFMAHCPHLNRLSSGEILLTFRGMTFEGDVKTYFTGLRVSRDEGGTWQGPYVLDTVIGAYPSTVELKDGTVFVVYYEEIEGSAIRASRFQLPTDISFLPFD